MTWTEFVWWTDENINHLRFGRRYYTISSWWCDLNEFYVGQCPSRFQNGWLMRRRRKANR